MNWFKRHFKQIIYVSFLFPILLVAFVSISHVTAWYGIANPFSWAIYLSVAVEVAALSSLAAIVAKMGNKVFIPFGIVTLIQFIGNIFFSYQYIDISTKMFKDWVDLVSPLVSYMGIEPTDLIGHKRLLAFLTGGMLPIISLTFLGFLVSFEKEDWEKMDNPPLPKEDPEQVIDAKDLMGEVTRIRPTEEDLARIQVILDTKKQEPPVMDGDEVLPNPDIPIQEPPMSDSPAQEPPEDIKEWVPALGDEEVREMFMDEYEHIYNLSEEDYDLLVSPQPEVEIPAIPAPVTPTPELPEQPLQSTSESPIEVTDDVIPQEDELKKK